MTDRWITQTTFPDPANPGSGNCTEASVASILGLPLCDVPNFRANGADSYNFWRCFRMFLSERGFYAMRRDEDFGPEGVLHLASGPSARGCPHMVVRMGPQIVHDPHPSRVGLLRVDHVWMLIPFDPTNLMETR